MHVRTDEMIETLSLLNKDFRFGFLEIENFLKVSF